MSTTLVPLDKLTAGGKRMLSKEIRQCLDWKEPEENEEKIVSLLNTRDVVKVHSKSIKIIDSLFPVIQKILLPVELSIGTGRYNDKGDVGDDNIQLILDFVSQQKNIRTLIYSLSRFSSRESPEV